MSVPIHYLPCQYVRAYHLHYYKACFSLVRAHIHKVFQSNYSLDTTSRHIGSCFFRVNAKSPWL